jgi:RHS repeat-associated protein
MVGNNGYQYKFQGQERQDELGLNWDSFKWRNYDYAIGRFMSIDPLAEKYVHNGVYNFSENRVIDARELEGLEAVKVTDLKNNQVNVTVKIKPINSTSVYPLSDKQVQQAFNNFKVVAEKSWSGKNKEGQQVNVTVVNDPEATLTINFVDTIDNPLIKQGDDGSSMLNHTMGMGFTSPEDVGNTQDGTIQISGRNTFDHKEQGLESLGSPEQTANHELGHIFGLFHNNPRIPGNLMNDEPKETERSINSSQRSSILLNIPEL